MGYIKLSAVNLTVATVQSISQTVRELACDTILALGWQFLKLMYIICNQSNR